MIELSEHKIINDPDRKACGVAYFKVEVPYEIRDESAADDVRRQARDKAARIVVDKVVKCLRQQLIERLAKELEGQTIEVDGIEKPVVFKPKGGDEIEGSCTVERRN